MSRLPATLLVPFVLLAAIAVGVGSLHAAGAMPGTTSEPVAEATAEATAAAPSPQDTASSPEEDTPLVVPGEGSLAGAGTAPGEGTDADRAPVAVRIPQLGVDSSLEDLQVDDAGRLTSPRRWQQAGWFADGTAPGDVGPAVIAGHVDSPTGPAVFARLGELGQGDRVEVERADGSVAVFEVDRTAVAGKDDFPTDEVYGPTPDAQLRLITCDGPYVRSSGGYQDNLVVWATEVAA